MVIPLSEFELHIPPQVLERGLEYYEAGRVETMMRAPSGGIQALVRGTEPYAVFLSLKSNTITSAQCDCPYDKAGPCKHIAAVIFAMTAGDFQDGIEDKSTKSKKGRLVDPAAPDKATGKKPKAAAKPKAAKRGPLTVEEMIDEASPAELARFMHMLAASHRDGKAAIMGFLGHAAHEELITGLKRKVKDIQAAVQLLGGEHVAELAQELMAPLWTQCEEAIEAGDFKVAFNILNAVLAEDVNAPYSHKVMDPQLVEAMLGRLSKAKLPDKFRKTIVEWLEKYIKARLAAYGNIDHLMAGYLRLIPDAASKLKVIQAWTKHFAGRYSRSDTHLRLANLIGEEGGQAEREAFIDKNLHIFHLRNERVQAAAASGDFKKAIKLAREGFHHQPNEWKQPSPWLDVILDLQRRSGDEAALRETLSSAYLTLMSGEQKYLGQLKDLVPPADWPRVRMELAAKVPQVYRARIAAMLFGEGVYADLYKFFLSQEMEFGMSMAASILPEDPEGYLEWVETAMLAELSRQRAGHYYHVYQRAIHLIRERKGREHAAKLVQTIISTYPTARALHDALRQ